MISDRRYWFVYYAKSRAEKRTKELLEKRGYECFLPITTVVRQWSDRKKRLQIPLFNGYLFVNSYAHEIQEVVQVPGIAWNIRQEGQPAILRENEKLMIEKLLESGYAIQTGLSVEDLSKGDKVRIVDGALKGSVGIVHRQAKSTVFITLDSIAQIISIEVDPQILEKI